MTKVTLTDGSDKPKVTTVGSIKIGDYFVDTEDQLFEVSAYGPEHDQMRCRNIVTGFYRLDHIGEVAWHVKEVVITYRL